LGGYHSVTLPGHLQNDAETATLARRLSPRSNLTLCLSTRLFRWEMVGSVRVDIIQVTGQTVQERRSRLRCTVGMVLCLQMFGAGLDDASET